MAGALAGSPALAQSAAERPANAVRSIQRLFTSEVEDKPWFYDREMWPRYLAMLAENRFNRFNLSFGIGYDFLRDVTDAYFLFAYPFFLSISGYNVRAADLADAERERNLETLRFIGEQTAAHGLEFQLGLWMHGYQWENSPHANYTIQGLNAENHGPYCRDALAARLGARALPPRQPGRALEIRRHGPQGSGLRRCHPWRIHRLAVPTPVLLRAEIGPGSRLAVPRIPVGPRRPALLRHPRGELASGTFAIPLLAGLSLVDSALTLVGICGVISLSVASRRLEPDE